MLVVCNTFSFNNNFITQKGVRLCVNTHSEKGKFSQLDFIHFGNRERK
jgi:hypothetical protein